jgi:hypothetical protein
MAKIFFLPLVVAIFLGATMAMDLTGDWKADNGDPIYLRQIDNAVWYYGESLAENENWTSVGYGTLEGNTIEMNWTDIPKGNASLMGTVTLNVTSDTELEVMDQTGGWAEKGAKLMKVNSGF